MRLEQADPKQLIRESFRIEDISPEQCRSIFLDWALSLGPGADTKRALKRVLAEYGAEKNHPMTVLLKEGLDHHPQTGRRGGRKAKLESHLKNNDE